MQVSPPDSRQAPSKKLFLPFFLALCFFFFVFLFTFSCSPVVMYVSLYSPSLGPRIRQSASLMQPHILRRHRRLPPASINKEIDEWKGNGNFFSFPLSFLLSPFLFILFSLFFLFSHTSTYISFDSHQQKEEARERRGRQCAEKKLLHACTQVNHPLCLGEREGKGEGDKKEVKNKRRAGSKRGEERKKEKREKK